MEIHRSHLLLCSMAWLAGCGGASPPPPAGDVAPLEGASAPAAPPSESAPPEVAPPGGPAGSAAGTAAPVAPSEPAPAAPKTRMEHCQLMGPAMQQVQQVGPIANAGDSAKLREMAVALRRELEPLAKAKLSHPELAALRDAYVTTTNDMAAALEEAASVQNANGQKAAVESFRKLEPKLGEHLEKLNAVCNAPGR